VRTKPDPRHYDARLSEGKEAQELTFVGVGHCVLFVFFFALSVKVVMGVLVTERIWLPFYEVHAVGGTAKLGMEYSRQVAPLEGFKVRRNSSIHPAEGVCELIDNFTHSRKRHQ
jgi:hypothetical protein